MREKTLWGRILDTHTVWLDDRIVHQLSLVLILSKIISHFYGNNQMPRLREFQFLATHAPYQLFRYAMDWDRQAAEGIESYCLKISDMLKTLENTPMSEHELRLTRSLQDNLAYYKKEIEKQPVLNIDAWEEEEPGSLKAVLEAYSYALPLIKENRRLGIEDIKELNSRCMSFSELCTGDFRDSGIGYGIFWLTASDSGLIELSKRHQLIKNLGLNEFLTFSGDEEVVLQKLRNIIKFGDIFHFNGYRGGLSKNELKQLHSKNPPIALKTKFITNVATGVKKILANLYSQLELVRADDSTAKLTVIVDHIKQLTRHHPFPDGNIRTFAMVMLNVLLMQHDFPPTLMDNPNKFDGHSTAELVALVQEGMQRTENLCRYVAAQSKKTGFFTADPESASLTVAKGENPEQNKPYPDWRDVPTNLREKLTGFAESLTQALLSATESPTFECIKNY